MEPAPAVVSGKEWMTWASDPTVILTTAAEASAGLLRDLQAELV